MLLFFLNFDVTFQRRMNIIIPQNISFSRSHVKLLYRYTVERKVQRHVQARKARSNLRHVRHVRNVISKLEGCKGRRSFLQMHLSNSQIVISCRILEKLIFLFLCFCFQLFVLFCFVILILYLFVCFLVFFPGNFNEQRFSGLSMVLASLPKT